MRRSLGSLSYRAIGHTTKKGLLISSPFDFSTSAGNGDGRGRGRGRGSGIPNFSFLDSTSEEETSFRAPLGHGRGKPQSPPPKTPKFPSFISPGLGKVTVAGRGRGTVSPPPPQEDNLKPRAPISFRKGEEVNLPPLSILSVLSSAGRGKPVQATTHVASEKFEEVNRHIKTRQLVGREPPPASPKMSWEEATGIFSRDGDGGGDGGGSGERGGLRGRGRGGGRSNQDEDEEEEEEMKVAKENEIKLTEREAMDLLLQAFEEACGALTSREEDSHANLECEQDLKALRVYFEKMWYGSVLTKKERQDGVEETRKCLFLIKEHEDSWSGKNRVTTKNQIEEHIIRVDKTLFASKVTDIKRYTELVFSVKSDQEEFLRKWHFRKKLTQEVLMRYYELKGKSMRFKAQSKNQQAHKEQGNLTRAHSQLSRMIKELCNKATCSIEATSAM